MYLANLTIAGLQIRLCSSRPISDLRIEKKLGPFLGDFGSPSATTSLQWQDTPGVIKPEGNLVYDPGSIWQMYYKKDSEQFTAFIHYCSKMPLYTARAILRSNSDWSQTEIIERRNGPRWHSLLALGAGELIVRTRILFTNGIVLHASGLDDNGKGIVFVGHSGAGKSTQSCLWAKAEGVIPVNDDRVAIRVNKSGSWIYGTPWGGSANIAKNHQADLKAICVLEKATTNSIHLLAAKTSIPLLLARSFLPYWDAELMSIAVNNIKMIAESIPVYLLKCRPEPTVISLVRSVL